jgi:Icc-related predicted phosphoesterase
VESGRQASRPLRLALTADVHADEAMRDALVAAFAEAPDADLVLIAGDLTTLGEPDQARILVEACSALRVPAVAILGNHDFHSGEETELKALLSEAGVFLLDGEAARFDLDGTSVGIAGSKGFVGGFPDWELPNFGEPLLRRLYDATTAEAEGLERALEEIAGCDVRIAMLHYAPTASTLDGEPQVIWPFLGSHRLGHPILEARPDLVLHGHAHEGTFEGRIGDVPVLNVAVAVTGRTFTVVEVARDGRDGRHAVRVLD